MKPKHAKALLPAAASLTAAIIASRQPSAEGVSVGEAVALLEQVLLQLDTSGLAMAEKASAPDRQLITPPAMPPRPGRKANKGKAARQDKPKPATP